MERPPAVFPTPVGVFLLPPGGLAAGLSLPHARGGVSGAWSYLLRSSMSSPRPWGCFSERDIEVEEADVFPTPVGVFPQWQKRAAGHTGLPHAKRPSGRRPGLPHARGGVSMGLASQAHIGLSSPRPWGCFGCESTQKTLQYVFPTPVGVFPAASPAPGIRWRLPHARGGVSLLFHFHCMDEKSSPRPWGCFYHR